MHMVSRAARFLPAVVGLACLLTSPAQAASGASKATLTIRGAGFGHGVGMSQYGALGMAQRGSSYRQILGHYYSDTDLGSRAGTTVRTLIANQGVPRFSGAVRLGDRRLRATTTYFARARGASVELRSPTGRRLAIVAAPLRLTPAGGGAVTVGGKGSYRGAIELRPAPGGLNVINAASIDDYVQGVVPLESPASWPLEALKAQAIAARTYALTTSKGGNGFEQYADTRSQVYGGIRVERPSTNQAVRETAGQVVTYQGRPVVTYFFSTSGGRTEDVENTSLGNRPLPWLRSVDDPADAVSPKHRWGPVRMSLGQADRKLGRLVKGAFRGIDVVERGVSPRVVAADIVGSRGRTRVTGATLRAELGLLDTWAYFTSISTEVDEPGESDEPAAASKRRRKAVTDLSGGAVAARGTHDFPLLTSTMPRYTRKVLTGRVVRSARGGRVTLQRRSSAGWRLAGRAGLDAQGRYRVPVLDAGVYRVRVGSATGPRVSVR